jgi:hypothetical protein
MVAPPSQHTAVNLRDGVLIRIGQAQQRNTGDRACSI